MKKWLLVFLTIGVLFVGYLFYSYFSERKTILFLNNSSLFEYYKEYQILYASEDFELKKFIPWVKKRDVKLGGIMELRKFHYRRLDDFSGDFYWTSNPKFEVLILFEYDFYNFLQQNKSVLLRPPYGFGSKYLKGYYYVARNDSLLEGEKINFENLVDRYKLHLRCNKIRTFKLNPSEISVFYNLEESSLITIFSTLDIESEAIVKEWILENSNGLNSSYFLLFDFHNLKDFECFDE